MKRCIPYLMFHGRAAEAAVFYQDLFGLEIIEKKRYGDADFQTPEGAEDYLIHCYLKGSCLELMLADSTEPEPEFPIRSVSFMMDCESEEEIHRLYNGLLEDGRRLMELQETFWGATYAKVEDRFGFTWDLNFESAGKADTPGQ